MPEESHGLDPLDALEQRVLGVLIEKALATPEQYPLTLHALTAGCNQRSNRYPPMQVSEPEARLTIDGLRRKGLAGIAHPAGGRVERYTHSAAERLGLPRPSLAVLAELLLRGPQSPGELRGRASRMEPIATLGDLAEVIARLKAKGLVAEHPPAPGSRAPRVAHRLSAAPAPAPASGSAAVASGARAAAPPADAGPQAGARAPLEPRVAALEAEVAALRRALGALADKLGEPLER